MKQIKCCLKITTLFRCRSNCADLYYCSIYYNEQYLVHCFMFQLEALLQKSLLLLLSVVSFDQWFFWEQNIFIILNFATNILPNNQNRKLAQKVKNTFISHARLVVLDNNITYTVCIESSKRVETTIWYLVGHRHQTDVSRRLGGVHMLNLNHWDSFFFLLFV